MGKISLALVSKINHSKKYKKSDKLQEASFYKLVYINSVSCNYKNTVIERGTAKF